MPRKRPTSNVIGPDWYIREWMASKRMSQAELGRRTGWAKSRVSEICNGKTDYYREIVNEVARAMEIHPWELLMSPEQANRIKRYRDSAIELAAEEHSEPHSQSDGDDELMPRRRTG